MSDEQRNSNSNGSSSNGSSSSSSSRLSFGGCDSGLETALCATRRGRSSLAGLAWLRAVRWLRAGSTILVSTLAGWSCSALSL
ncbi:hypothetical protein B0T13DRAFT_458033, partial [Neurospora crassa]